MSARNFPSPSRLTSPSSPQPPQAAFGLTPLDNVFGPVTPVLVPNQYYHMWKQTVANGLQTTDGRSRLEANKHGIVVSKSADFGYIDILSKEQVDLDEKLSSILDVHQNGPTPVVNFVPPLVIDDQVGRVKTLHYTISNTAKFAVQLKSVSVLPSREQLSLRHETGQPVQLDTNLALTIPPGSDYTFQVACHQSTQSGMIYQWVLFTFDLPIIGDFPYSWGTQNFVIARRNIVVNRDPERKHTLSPEMPAFVPHDYREVWKHRCSVELFGRKPDLPEIVSAVKAKSLSAFQPSPELRKLFNESMAQYFEVSPTSVNEQRAVEQYVRDSFKREAEHLDELSSVSLVFNVPLRKHFLMLQYLLCLEELHHEHDVKQYALYNVKLEPVEPHKNARGLQLRWPMFKKKQKHFCYFISVPGVGERRPAVDVGDVVELRDAAAPFSVSLFSYVYDVSESKVMLHVPIKRYNYTMKRDDMDKRRYHVCFKHKQTEFVAMHQAIMQLQRQPSTERLLWPPAIASESKHADSSAPPRRLFNKTCNEEQVQVVHKVLTRTHGAHPFIIFGPPGTGKTLTLIETINQIVEDANANRPRVLICTPSEYSADIVCERLSATRAGHEMLRLNLSSRYTPVSETVRKHCVYSSITNIFAVPELESLLEYQLIVCTCKAAYALYLSGVPRGHYNVIAFDESSQALEPELYIPLMLCNDHTRVILAGDHMQLGAPVKSTLAAKFGLRISLQERLLQRKMYQGPDSPFTTKLVRNYRSHADILRFSSDLFYDSELQACGPPEVINSMLNWPGLPNPRRPVMFYGVIGEDRYEPESSSISNPTEAKEVVKIVLQLLEHEGVYEKDIGIITPYRKQVLLLRHRLRAKNLFKVRVGGVEDYQGKEERIIIVSTVLAKRRPFTSGDVNIDDSLVGVLKNPKRFNVSLSRAQALNIVVGNPFILKDEPNWKTVLQVCMRIGAYAGCDQPVLDVRGRRPASSEEMQYAGDLFYNGSAILL